MAHLVGEFFFQVIIGISILRGLDKCDSDKSRISDLNQSSCSVPTTHTDISEIYER